MPAEKFWPATAVEGDGGEPALTVAWGDKQPAVTINGKPIDRSGLNRLIRVARNARDRTYVMDNKELAAALRSLNGQFEIYTLRRREPLLDQAADALEAAEAELNAQTPTQWGVKEPDGSVRPIDINEARRIKKVSPEREIVAREWRRDEPNPWPPTSTREKD